MEGGKREEKRGKRAQGPGQTISRRERERERKKSVKLIEIEKRTEGV